MIIFNLKEAMESLLCKLEVSDFTVKDILAGAAFTLAIVGGVSSAVDSVEDYIKTVASNSNEVVDEFIPCASAICIEEDMFQYCIPLDSPKKANVKVVKSNYENTFFVRLKTQGSKSCLEQ